jgi:subtilisin family serine protease
VIARTEAKGILFIAAAGNETVDNDKLPTYPANYSLDNIISVAAIDDHKDLSWFSNWGEKSVHVSAPGESILSTTTGYKHYGYKDGTSMAAPHITGAAALLWAAHPDWNYLQVKDYILGHCQVDKLKIIPVQCQGYFSF